MRKKFPVALSLVLVFLLLIGCFLYFLHRSTPFDLTLNATKFDKDGNEIGTTQITIRGNRLDYLFQKDRVEIEVDPFDEWSRFLQIKDASSGKKGEIFSYKNKIKWMTFDAVEGDEFASCILYFTTDFDHFALYILGDEGKTTYLASVGNDHTADKVLDHFKEFNFNPLPNRKIANELTLKATKFDQNGTELGTLDIPIILYETGDYFADGILDIEIQAFDGWSSTILSQDATTGKEGRIRNPIDGLYRVDMAAFYGNSLKFCSIEFTESFDHFILNYGVGEERYTYLATLGLEHSADKVLDHFRTIQYNPLPSK